MSESTKIANGPNLDFSYAQLERQGRKIFHFSSGPGSQPKEVLVHAQNNLLDWEGSGISVLEMSHRSKEFKVINERAKSALRQMAGIPDNFEILFT